MRLIFIKSILYDTYLKHLVTSSQQPPAHGSYYSHITDLQP